MCLAINFHDHYGVQTHSFVYLGRVIAVRDEECNDKVLSYVSGLRRYRLHHHILRDRTIKARVRVILTAFVVLRLDVVVGVYVRGFLDRYRQALRRNSCPACLLFREDVGNLWRIRIVCRAFCRLWLLRFWVCFVFNGVKVVFRFLYGLWCIWRGGAWDPAWEVVVVFTVLVRGDVVVGRRVPLSGVVGGLRHGRLLLGLRCSCRGRAFERRARTVNVKHGIGQNVY